MKTRRDYLVRIRQVIGQGLLNELSDQEKQDVIAYIEDNNHKLRELSLRMVIKIASIRQSTANWQQVSNVTCCKN